MILIERRMVRQIPEGESRTQQRTYAFVRKSVMPEKISSFQLFSALNFLFAFDGGELPSSEMICNDGSDRQKTISG